MGGAGRGAIRRSIERMPRLLLHRRLQALLATGYAEGLFIFGALAFVAIYLQRRYGIGPGLAGTLVTAYAAGGLVYALVARRAVRRLGERGLATLGGTALVIGYVTLAFAPSSGVATAGIAGVGAGFYMLHTTVQTHVTHVAPEERGSAVALFATFLFLGQASGVWLGAQIVDTAGLAPVFLAAAAGLAALAALFRYYLSGGT
jgi:predicted MFS family arabinose efflux permease